MADTHVTLTGNLTDDPELRVTPNGAAVANFRLAVTPRVKDGTTWKDGETSYFRVNAWRDLAENLTESLGKGFGGTQVFKEPFVVAKDQECIAQVKAQVDGLFEQLAALRQMLHGKQRPLKPDHGLLVSRACHRLGTRLPEISERLVPYLPLEGMVGKRLDLVGETVGIARFNRLNSAGVQGAPPVAQETCVRHLVSQGVLEGVDLLRKAACRVEKLGRLEV